MWPAYERWAGLAFVAYVVTSLFESGDDIAVVANAVGIVVDTESVVVAVVSIGFVTPAAAAAAAAVLFAVLALTLRSVLVRQLDSQKLLTVQSLAAKMVTNAVSVVAISPVKLECNGKAKRL